MTHTTTTDAATIDIRAVTRKFGRTTALDEVSTSLPAHGICGLLGRNGAGKTTLMSILAGQDRPDSGSVSVFGRTPFENSTTLGRISYVRDNQRYPDDYRLGHVLRIAPHFAPRWSDEIADELVERLRIPERTKITKLSRGQLSSIAIVLGIASRAPLTLLDEPYLGLDVTARAVFHDVLLRDFVQNPRAIVLSTHLIAESERLFDRVVLLDGGTVRVDCERDEIADLAFTVSGPTAAVERVTAGRRMLRVQEMAGLTAATVDGMADDEVRSAAAQNGLTVSSATLQDIVAAYGETEPTHPTTTTQNQTTQNQGAHR